mmetsp:Transcript_10211/g.12703  ORF Transcript_10211/g.12703 Transcript_10211/m.12703 type:complete len:359 (+) Transcript_10211:57-1133(+)
MAEARKAFLEELKVLSKLKNFRRCMLLDSIDDDDATLQDYHELNKIFIDPYCYNQLKRLTEAFKMSIKDDWNDGHGFSFQNTGTSYYKHRVFEQEIHFIFGLKRANKDKHGFNAFMALFVCRLDWEWAFHDTEDLQTAQQLIYSLCFLFDYFMRKSIKEIGYGNETKRALHKLMVSMDVSLENITFIYERLEEYLNTDDDMDGYFREMKNKETPEMKNIQELSLKERNEWITYGFIRMISCNEGNADIKKLILEYTKNRYWTRDELEALKLDELKIFCNAYGLRDDGRNTELIERLMFPEQYIYDLKREYHYVTVWETSDDQLARDAQFAEERYRYNIFTKDIEERKEYWDELFGVDL